MPFTPFHFGPGMLVKTVAPRRFWLKSFLLANVLVDCEVPYYLWRRSPPLHRYLHSYVGGTVAGLVAGLAVFAVLGWVERLRIGSNSLAEQQHTVEVHSARRLAQSVFAEILGGVSHIAFDSLMHRDMRPFWPVSDANGLLGLVDVRTLHIALAATGFLGLVLWMLRWTPV